LKKSRLDKHEVNHDSTTSMRTSLENKQDTESLIIIVLYFILRLEQHHEKQERSEQTLQCSNDETTEITTRAATACKHSLEAKYASKYEYVLDFEFRQQEKGELDLTTLAGAPSRKWTAQTQSARARSKQHTHGGAISEMDLSNSNC
jgi:hypothetical protein